MFGQDAAGGQTDRNTTRSWYDPPYHLGKTRLMVHDADGDENYGSDDEFDDHLDAADYVGFFSL